MSITVRGEKVIYKVLDLLLDVLEKICGGFDEGIVYGLLVIILFSMISGFVIGVGNAFDGYSCGEYGEVTGRDVRHVFLSGCYVEYGGAYIPVGEFEKRAMTNEK